MTLQQNTLNAMGGASDRNARSQQAKFLGQRIWWLFWLIIPTIIGNTMTQEKIVQAFPTLKLPGEIISWVTLAAYALILIQMRTQNKYYLISGCCMIADGILSCVLEVLNATNPSVWGNILLIPGLIVGLCAAYYEYSANAQILASFDERLSKCWSNLWKWYIGVMLALLFEMVLVFLTSFVGLILVLITTIVALVVSIMKLVYLYRTAQLLRHYEP